MQDKNKTPINEKGEHHGYWETYYNNGRLEYKGLFINSYKFGLHECFFSDGELIYKANYIDNDCYGYHKYISEEYYAR
jgi:antitoxin component YwqK of YwqJK toxin-antitoxin module